MQTQSKQHLRLLPLLSSATEMVHALGLGSFQIGRSHECDYPPQVASLPVCTWPAIAVDGSSAEIDQLVKDQLASALSIYQVDADLIRKLRPTHIITQTQCKVCAVSLEDVERALQDATSTETKLIAVEPYALRDVWADLRRVGEACGCAGVAESLVSSLCSRMESVATRAAGANGRPTVAAIEWLEPLMAAGNWVPELIEMAGGQNLFGVAGSHSPWMDWEQVVLADPDVIVALPCGFDLARTHGELHWLKERPGWSELRAVRAGRVFLCDGNQFMNRPGPRLVESLEIFAQMLHPDVFQPTLEGIGWKRLF
ncbi:MAG TPA: cobalamin-binding protein [Bryobacteraceae bacterium]|nr:cobalamin-binding protein [Bryobacteraceae bacterium]